MNNLAEKLPDQNPSPVEMKVISTPCGVGEKLRKAREARGFSRARVAQRLNVTESYITYIDENAFASLPSATFVRSYLRNYALYVGLEVEDVLTDYQRYLDANVEPVKLRKRQQLKAATSDPIMRLLGILSVLLFVLSSLYFWRNEQAVTPIASAENISVVEVETVAGETLIEAVDLNSTVEQRVVESVLLVTFTDSSWLEVRNANDEVLFSGVKLAGDEIRLASPSFFDIAIGNAAAVKLSYNSAPVDLSTVTQGGNAATLQLGFRQP